MKKLLAIVLLAATISSCKKNTDNTVIPNTSLCPVTAGSSWNYVRNSSDSAYRDSIYTFKATDSTKTINNKTYNVFNSSAGSDVYYAITDSGFYRSGSLLAGLGIPELESFEELYLKKNPTKDSAWSTTLPITYLGSPYTVKLTYAIPSITDTLTVLGKNYSNLIHVNVVFSTSVTFGTYTIPVSLGTGDFYYGKGIGLVSFVVTLSPPSGTAVTNTFNLKSYTVK